MYLRLEIEGEESFHSFPDKKRITIGRAPTSDIQVMAEGVSRHHLEIHEKAQGDIYAVDKGSTHGTFINDEQLEKDSPVAFNTFFPAQMGENVFVYLLDEAVSEDEEVEDNSEALGSSLDNFFDEGALAPQDETPQTPPKPSETFNLDPPKPVKKKPQIHVPKSAGVNNDMQKLLKKREETRTKAATRKGSKAPKKKKKVKQESKNKIITIALIFSFLSFAGYKQWQKIQAKKLARIKAEEARQAKIKAELEKEKLEEEKRLRLAAIEKAKKQFASQVKNYVNRDKCLLDLEIQFCNPMKNLRRDSVEGVVKQADILYIIMDPNSLRRELASYNYPQRDLEGLFIAAKQTVGRAFHQGKFSQRMNYKLEDPVINKSNYNALAIGDLLWTYNRGFPKTDEINRIILITVDNRNFVSYVELDKDVLYKEDFNAYRQNIIYAFRSNILSPLKRMINKFELKPGKKKVTKSLKTQ